MKGTSLVRAAARRALRTLGLEVRRRTEEMRFQTNADHALATLLASVGAPVIFDVGANRGQSVARFRKLFADATVHAFEPGPAAFSELAAAWRGNPRVVLHDVAVAEAVAEFDLFEGTDDTTSSLSPPASGSGRYFDARVTRRSRVRAVTLDEVARTHQVERIDLLKVDVQGGELRVLMGAEALLDRRAVRVVYTEVLFAELYEGQSTFGQLWEHLTRRGYELVGLYDLAFRRRRLCWADAIFTIGER